MFRVFGMRFWVMVFSLVLGLGILFHLEARAGVVLYEDFESGSLNAGIQMTTVGAFTDPPGIKDISDFGSSKAFGFGRSECPASCIDSYTTSLKIEFASPTYVSSISFKEMELYGNWGSGGILNIDGVSVSDPFYLAFGRLPYNDGTADTSYRVKLFEINQLVTTIELKVWDITIESEILIDDLLVLGADFLPKTGQTNCYDSSGSQIDCGGTGQDGDVQAGLIWPSPRFTDNGDGTVTDNLSGLIWLKNASCIGSRTWAQALDSTNSLASGQCGLSDGSLAGDWRLPNVNELESLVHYGYQEEDCGGAACATIAAWLNSQGFNNVQQAYYWSSTSYEFLRTSALVASMWVGLVDYGPKGNSYYVLPVRGESQTSSSAPIPRTGQSSCYDASGTQIDCTGTGQDGELQAGVPWPDSRFLDNQDGTVTDTLTGLTWLKDANCFGERDWWDALSAANALGHGQCALSDRSIEGEWRLPNLKELRSLVDYSQSSPALQSAHPFTGVQEGPYWSSTTYLYDPGMARIVSIWGGVADKAPKGSGTFVWPVRESGWMCASAPSGMVSWWKGDNNSFDIAGANHGNLVNGTSYARGKVGYGFSFDGVDDHVEMTGSDVGDFGSDPFTVDFWMYSNNNGGNAYILGKSHPDGGLGWDMRLDGGRILVSGIDGWAFNIISDSSAGGGSWHHIALVATETEASLYIDGLLKNTSSRSAISSTSNPFRIGYTTNFGGSPFEGIIDEVTIYNRALSPEEVLAIYDSGASGKCRPQVYFLSVGKEGTGHGSVSSAPAGISCGGDCENGYYEGMEVALTASPDPGSSFSGWGGDVDCSDGHVTMDSDKTCTATFLNNQYSITATSNPPEGGSVLCSPNPVEHGSSSTCTITANEGYALEEVSGTCGGTLSGDTFTTNPVTGECTVVAEFVLNTYSLSISKQGAGSGTVTSIPAGIACGPDCNESLESGTEVTLEATPDAGSSFAGWGGDVDCSDGHVTMDSDKSCTATFIPITSLRLLSPNGAEEIPSGSNLTIQWEAPASAQHYTLKLSLDNGGTWSTLASNITGNQYEWTTPKPASNKTKSLIKVIGYGAGGTRIGEDTSDSPFTIEVLKLVSPNGGESLSPGSRFDVQWTTNQTKKPVSKVVLLYSLNGGLSWRTIDRLEGNDGHYEWTVPAVSSLKTRCKLKVILKDALGNRLGSDQSDGFFAIGAL